ncbi:relaxase/mobilization nuclease domain-containing protein [Oscillospiraceae bacterium OttesenSCG-928-F05]|nr:relaxase/mobilization nuclease domain-containing protein [Oscillospiraceae bacterium OttesenSCG-928-F05]
MATTKIWSVNHRLAKVINYVQNPEKTVSTSKTLAFLNELHNSDGDFSGEQVQNVSAINCEVESALDEMNAAKDFFNQRSGILAFHCCQSFPPGEDITPEEAHEIGREFARRVWGDRFQVIIATHSNTDHIHNHFVANSVSFVDGKRYHDNKDTYYNLIRKTSDEVCREYGKSVIEKSKSTKKSKHYAERAAEKEGRPTIKSQIIDELDEVISNARSLNHFYEILRGRGYIIRGRDTRKSPTIQPPFSKSRFRLNNLGDGEYSEEAITERIRRLRQGEPERDSSPATNTDEGRRSAFADSRPSLSGAASSLFQLPSTPDRPQGKQALYFDYLVVVSKAGRRQLPQRLRYPLREDVTRFEKLKRQYEYLRLNRITTTGQLDRHTEHIHSLISTLTDRRRALYRAKRRGEDVKGEITEYTGHLRALRREIRTIDAINGKEPEIYRNLKAVQDLDRKEQRTRSRGRGRRNRDNTHKTPEQEPPE